MKNRKLIRMKNFKLNYIFFSYEKVLILQIFYTKKIRMFILSFFILNYKINVLLF